MTDDEFEAVNEELGEAIENLAEEFGVKLVVVAFPGSADFGDSSTGANLASFHTGGIETVTEGSNALVIGGTGAIETGRKYGSTAVVELGQNSNAPGSVLTLAPPPPPDTDPKPE